MGKQTRRTFVRMMGMGAAATVAAACQPKVVEKVVKETIVVEKEVAKEVTRVVQQEVDKEVTRVVEKVVAAEPSAKEPVKISFMNFWGGERVQLMDEVIGRFQEEFPHITVENAVTPGDNQQQARATAILSGSPPSLIMAPRTEAIKFAVADLLQPLDSYIEADNIDPYEVFYTSEIQNHVFNGHYWSFPMPTGGGSNNLWYYNKNVMRDAGLDPESPPVTWQDVMDIVKATTTITDGNVERTGLVSQYFPFDAWIFCNNGRYYSDDSKQLLFNQPEGVETLEWMLSLLNDHLGGIEAQRAFFEGIGYKNADWPFYTNRACLWPAAAQHFFGFKVLYPDMAMDTEQWGICLVPYNGDNPQAEPHGTSGLTLAWNQVIPQRLPPDVQAAAYEFLKFFTMRKAGGCWFVFEQGRPSPVKSCNENPDYYDAMPYWGEILESMAIDVSIPIAPPQSEIEAVLTEALEEVWFGVRPPKDALDWAQAKGQAILDDYWSKA